MPKSQKSTSARGASAKKPRPSKNGPLAKLRTKFHHLEPHQQAAIKRITILVVLLLVFVGTYAYRKYQESQIVYFSDNEISITDTNNSIELTDSVYANLGEKTSRELNYNQTMFKNRREKYVNKFELDN